MSDENEEAAKVSHQSLRKDELRLLAASYEAALIGDLERAQQMPDGIPKTMLLASFPARAAFLARLEAMGLTVGFKGWGDVAASLSGGA